MTTDKPKSLDKSANKYISKIGVNEESSNLDLERSVKILEIEEEKQKENNLSDGFLGSMGLLSAGYLVLSRAVGEDKDFRPSDIAAGIGFGSVISAYLLYRRNSQREFSRALQTFKGAVKNITESPRDDHQYTNKKPARHRGR